MNPDEAYRLQTDWARAVTRPGTPTADWMARRTWQVSRPMTGDDSKRHRRLSEPTVTIEAMRRAGPVRDTNMVVAFQKNEDYDPDALPTDVYEAATVEPAPGFTPTDLIIPEAIYSEVTPVMLSNAPTYYVTADMCTVMEVAAAAFDEFDLMPRLPRSSGFVVLARPIELPMPGGTSQPVRAFAWNTWGEVSTSMGTTGAVGEVWTFASRKRDADFVMVQEAAKVWPSKKAWRSEPDLLPCYGDWVAVGTPLPPVAEAAAIGNARIRAHDWGNLNFPAKFGPDGAPVAPTQEEWEARLNASQARYDQYLAEEMEQAPDDQYGYWQPYLAAFVLLLTQQITVAEPTDLPEATVRLARKVNPTRPSTVTVVDVRHVRRTGSAREPTGATRGPLTSRQLVGSHWKWQPYGTKRALRRRIFVSGYVRGPEDAPLVVKPRVIRL